MTAFSSFLKLNLPEAKLKRFGLSTLAEKISKQLNVDCVLWLLLGMIIPIYSEKEQLKLHWSEGKD